MKKISLSFIFVILTTIVNAQNFYNFCQTYGKSLAPSYEKVNCVKFMDIALKKYLKIDNKSLSKYIYINYDIDVIKKALEKNDVEIIGGVCTGLTRHKLAKWVDFKDIQKGDIVQYWSTTGFINGHCGIFDSFDEFGNVILIGSHGDSKGYGYMNCYNTSLNCKFFVCRLN